MMVWKELAGSLSVIISLISYTLYFRSIFNGKTKPHAFSWLIWGLLVSINFFAQYSNGAGPGAWATGFVAFLCFVVAAIALFRGEKNITRSDWITFIAALLIIPVWYYTSDALIAVIMVMIIDTFGYYPTFRKSYHKPNEEAAVLYVLGVVQVCVSMLAMEHYYLVNIMYPIFICFLNSTFVFMLVLRRKALI